MASILILSFISNSIEVFNAMCNAVPFDNVSMRFCLVGVTEERLVISYQRRDAYDEDHLFVYPCTQSP